MKILKSFLVVLTLVTFIACSSDDDSGNSDPVQIDITLESLAGNYEIVYYAGSGQTTVTATGGTTFTTERDVYSGTTFTNARLTFNTDNTYSFSGSYVESYTITVAGQDPETEEYVVVLDESGPFTFNNASRTITLDGEMYEVTFFNGASLRMVNSYEETFPGGVTETDSFEFRMVKE